MVDLAPTLVDVTPPIPSTTAPAPQCGGTRSSTSRTRSSAPRSRSSTLRYKLMEPFYCSSMESNMVESLSASVALLSPLPLHSLPLRPPARPPAAPPPHSPHSPHSPHPPPLPTNSPLRRGSRLLQAPSWSCRGRLGISKIGLLADISTGCARCRRNPGLTFTGKLMVEVRSS